MLLVHPTPEQRVYTRKIFNERPERTRRDLEAIKEWLAKQPHLPNTWDEQRLLTFLRGCRFSLETCKKKLDTYFTVRAAMPEFFSNRNIANPELQEMLELLDGAVLPNLTPDCGRVTVARAARQDFDTPNVADFIKIIFMIGDLRLGLEEHGVPHDVYVLDAGFPIKNHFLKVSPLLLKKVFICIQEAYPVVIKEVHIVNVSPFIDFVINGVKPFLNETLRRSIHVHTKIETLYDFVPREILPEEYGGGAGKLRDLKMAWVGELERATGWFEEQEGVKADESRRPGKYASYYENVLGIPGSGSFRELAID